MYRSQFFSWGPKLSIALFQNIWYILLISPAPYNCLFFPSSFFALCLFGRTTCALPTLLLWLSCWREWFYWKISMNIESFFLLNSSLNLFPPLAQIFLFFAKRFSQNFRLAARTPQFHFLPFDFPFFLMVLSNSFVFLFSLQVLQKRSLIAL